MLANLRRSSLVKLGSSVGVVGGIPVRLTVVNACSTSECKKNVCGSFSCASHRERAHMQISPRDSKK